MIEIPNTHYAPCPYCGRGHPGTCHRVKAIEYYPDGSVKRVELHEPKQHVSSVIVGYDNDGTPLVKAGPGEMLTSDPAKV